MKRLAPLLGLLSMCACGGGGGSPAVPSVQAPTISTTNTTIYVGQTVQFTASGAGTIRWGGDAPGVATVDPASGRVTGVGNGRVTIWAENEGGRTTRLLRGLPSYAGTWSGTYAVTGCQATGDILTISFCGNFSASDILSIGLQISQTDDRVTGGSFTLGSLPGTLTSSTISEQGQLPLAGTTGTGQVTIVIQNASLDSPNAGAITGTFDQSWTVAGATGAGILTCSVRSMARTSGGPTFGFRQPGRNLVTLREMISAIKGR